MRKTHSEEWTHLAMTTTMMMVAAVMVAVVRGGGGGGSGGGGGGPGGRLQEQEGATRRWRLAHVNWRSDPNEKHGASGFGEDAFIAPDTVIPYRVHFENLGPGSDPTPAQPATAPRRWSRSPISCQSIWTGPRCNSPSSVSAISALRPAASITSKPCPSSTTASRSASMSK